MTNGEKFKEVFKTSDVDEGLLYAFIWLSKPDEVAEINIDWWNAGYKESTEKCTWIKYDYRTVCPKEHDADNPYWRIPENRMETLKYCPYCGKEIEVEE